MTADRANRVPHQHPVAVTKAAALVAGVPGVGAIIHQTDWPPIHVTRQAARCPAGQVWIPLSPERFRSELLLPPEERSTIGPTLGDEGTRVRVELRVEVRAVGSTTLDDSGLFTRRLDGARRAVGFAALAQVAISGITAGPRDCVGPDGCHIEGWPRMVTEVDLELGTQLATWPFPANDGSQTKLARAMAMDALLRTSVEEITHLVARH